MISDSILSTLTYSDHFGFPLTFSELHERLVDKFVSKKSLMSNLASMLKKNLIEKTDIYYHLRGKESLVSLREKRQELSRTLHLSAIDLSQKISRVPGIIAIYLTGSLAMKNSDKDADIDFMIITQNSRLWLTRLILTLYTTAIGLRRLPGEKNHSGKLCLNLYLTPRSWTIPHSKRSLYTAYELVQAVPVYDPQKLRASLLTSNNWVKEYLPNYKFPQNNTGIVVSSNFVSPMLAPLEFLAYVLQKLYMYKRLTTELVTINSAFFHPHNPGVKVLRKLSVN